MQLNDYFRCSHYISTLSYGIFLRSLARFLKTMKQKKLNLKEKYTVLNLTIMPTSLLIIMVLLTPLFSFTQSGVLKSPTGYLVYSTTDSLGFTMRLDEPNSRTPVWETVNKLILLKRMDLQYIYSDDINCKNKSEETSLNCYMKWEEQYLRSSTPKKLNFSIKIDRTFKPILKEKVLTNAWYYSLIINGEIVYSYFLDFVYKGLLFRINYGPSSDLDSPRLFINAVYTDMKFYNHKIEIEKLISALKSNKYEY